MSVSKDSERVPASTITRTPFAGSKRVYVQGELYPDVRVPMREVSLAPTRAGKTLVPNPAVVLYDTSGPYTDPAVTIDLHRGLEPVRASWIAARGDTETLATVSSAFGRGRATDPALAPVRFPSRRAPLRAAPGQRVTQMHYARRGIVTPEMEFIAIRENHAARGHLRAHPRAAPGRVLRRGDPEGDHAGVRARRGRARPRDHPVRTSTTPSSSR
jgi:phosphomethylpyrimidine synthase